MLPNNATLDADDDDFQSEILRHLIKMGLAFPETEEELDHFLIIIDQEKTKVPVCLPTAAEILARGYAELPDSLNPSLDGAIEDNLAQAAREGGEISPEVLARMEQDRKASEKDQLNDHRNGL